MNNLIVVIVTLLAADVSSSNWHYGDESHWQGKCKTGTAQSPINFDEKIAVEKHYEKIVFSNYYLELPANITNNGHSVQVTLAVRNPQPSIKGGGLAHEYLLDHLHFHWQSEHTVNNYRFPLEVHLVHFAREYRDLSSALQYKDGVAVLGVFYDLSPDDDTEFQPLVNLLGNVEKAPKSTKPMDKTRVSSFLPRDTAGFYRYNGSLTTPECTEAVIWTVFTNTMPISKAQVKHFEAIHSDEGVLKQNYRSLQDLHGRTIYRKVSPIPHGSAKSNLETSFVISLALLVLGKCVS